MFDLLIRNGRVIDGTGLPWFRADVGITGDRIAAVGQLGNAEAKTTIDAAGKVVCPGFVDAHVHGDLPLLVDPYHEPAVRQGVTTYVVGQDGVAFAPASPETMRYMRRYTAGFNGNLPDPRQGLADRRRVPGAVRPQLRHQRLHADPQRQRPHGGDGPGQPPADRRRDDGRCGGSSARGWSRGRSACPAGWTTSRASTPTRTS